jgi:glycine/D-amino acid oxidase-like deaminating enzyme
MDLRSGCPLWPIRDGLPAAYPALDADAACEIAVIGGGITGALAADALSAAGVDTLLLDRRDIGWGSTSATTALIQYELDTPLYRLAAKMGEMRAVECFAATRGALDSLDALARSLGGGCGYARRPSLYLASRTSHARALEREHEARNRHGFPVELWDRRRLASRMPFERAAALFTEDAAELDPYRFTHALIARSAARGARIHDRTEVVRTELEAGVRPSCRVRLVTGAGHAVTARGVVFATGYETQARLRQPTVSLHSTYALASEPVPDLSAWHRRCLIWETARPYLYLRTTDDDRVIVGGEDDPFLDPRRRDAALPRKAARLARRFGRLFPGIAFEPAYSWAGTFAETADHLPWIGRHPDYPNAWFAAAYGGNGVSFGVLAAEIIRDAVCGKRHPAEALFGFDRPEG